MSKPDVSATKSASTSTNRPKRRRILLQFLVICVPLWLSLKFYNGPYHEQVGSYLAGILLLINLALVIQLIFPDLKETPVLVGLFLLMSGMELLCWQNPGLFENLSITLGGQTLIGEVFSINRIPYYGVGAFIGYFVLRACRAS